MKKITFLVILTIQTSFGQSVLISPNNGSKLIETNSTNKAVQLPSVTATTSIVSPQKGMVVFDDATGTLSYFNGTNWIPLSNSSTGWAINSNHLSNTNSGNVGIGIASPAALLDISSTTKGILIPRMTTSQRNLLSPVLGLKVYDITTKGFWFHDGTAWQPLNPGWDTDESKVFTNAFNNLTVLGIGLTPLPTTGSPGGSVTNGRLQIQGINNGDQLTIRHPNSPVLRWGFYVSGIDSSLNFYYNGNVRANIDRVTGVYSTLSDRNLKKNIVGLNSVLGNVLKLNAYKYNYLKSDETDRKSIGFMAQDVLSYFPELVYHKKDRETNEPFLMMDYNSFGVVAIKAIQEQQAIINNLQTQIDELRKLIKK